MKLLTLSVLAAATLALAGCSSTDDSSGSIDQGSTVAGAGKNPGGGGVRNAFQHPDMASDNGTGGPQGDPGGVAATRYHGCTKLTYASLGSVLSTRGAKLTGPDDALSIYKSGAQALGVASYAGRVPEAQIASTSAMAKQFDVFVAAAPEIQANLTTSSACPGVTLQTAGKFTKDGLSCLMGKLAKDEHVSVANQAVSDAVAAGATQDEGIQLAISAILEAAHTCE